MKFVKAAFKLFVETLHLTVAKFVNFLEQFAHRLLNLILQTVELLQCIVHQTFDLGGGLSNSLLTFFTILSTFCLAFFAMDCLLTDKFQRKIRIRPFAGNRKWSLGNDGT